MLYVRDPRELRADPHGTREQRRLVLLCVKPPASSAVLSLVAPTASTLSSRPTQAVLQRRLQAPPRSSRGTTPARSRGPLASSRPRPHRHVGDEPLVMVDHVGRESLAVPYVPVALGPPVRARERRHVD